MIAGEHRRLPGLEHRGAGLGRASPQPGWAVAEVGAGGRLDPVGALAEVDRVQVLGEDLVLAPVALELVGERRLAELLEDRPAALRLERVLDELLGDRRGALGGALAEDVLDQRRGRCPGSRRRCARRSACPRSRPPPSSCRARSGRSRARMRSGCWSAGSRSCCPGRRGRPSSWPRRTPSCSRAGAGPARSPSSSRRRSRRSPAGRDPGGGSAGGAS